MACQTKLQPVRGPAAATPAAAAARQGKQICEAQRKQHQRANADAGHGAREDNKKRQSLQERSSKNRFADEGGKAAAAASSCCSFFEFYSIFSVSLFFFSRFFIFWSGARVFAAAYFLSVQITFLLNGNGDQM